MKIIHVIDSIAMRSAGTTDAVLSLCENQTKLGMDVTLYTLNPVPNDLTVNFQIKSFDRLKFPHPSLGRSINLYRALEIGIRNSDVVHTHMLWQAPLYYAGNLAIKFNKVSICSTHGALTKYAVNRSRYKKVLSLILGQYKALKGVTYLHLTSELERKELNGTIWDLPNFIVPIGVNGPARAIAKNSSKQILFLSRIHPKKGLEKLLSDFLEVREFFPEWSLRVYGPIEDMEYFESLSGYFNGDKSIFYGGEVFGDDKFRVMTEAELFVLPTLSENFGLVVGEALLCGTPVICTTGAPWADLEKFKSGWWVDHSHLKEALIEAMTLTTEDRVEMGKAGRDWINESYSWLTIAREMIDHYRRARQNLRGKSL